MFRVYLTSNNDNNHLQGIINALESAGHVVSCSNRLTSIKRNLAMEHPAFSKFESNLDAMRWADICILALPCDKFAFFETGWASGAGKHTVVFTQSNNNIESALGLVDKVVETTDELLRFLDELYLISPSCINPIDLGLSVLWADRNLGATSEIGNGGFYGWTELNERYVLRRHRGQKTVKFDDWRLPTWDEALELMNKCQWSGKWIGNQFGQIALGPSGESIFFPYAGYHSDYWEEDAHALNYCGLYLTSRIINGNSTFMRLENSRSIEAKGDITASISVRLVRNKK